MAENLITEDEALKNNFTKNDINNDFPEFSNSHPISCCPNRIFVSYINSQGICSVISSALLIIIPTMLFYIFVIPLYSSLILKIIFYCISVPVFIILLYVFFDTGTTSPGYADLSKQLTMEEFEKIKPYVIINEVRYDLGYCPTCKIVKNLRVFHCKICNRCVLRHDHHCGFVNNCIGKKNHLKFLIFIILVAIHSLIILVINAPKVYDAYFEINEKTTGISAYIISTVVEVIAILFFIMMIVFAGNHLWMISHNITTSQNLRRKYKDDAFDKGCSLNWKEFYNSDEEITYPVQVIS